MSSKRVDHTKQRFIIGSSVVDHELKHRLEIVEGCIVHYDLHSLCLRIYRMKITKC